MKGIRYSQPLGYPAKAETSYKDEDGEQLLARRVPMAREEG